MHESLLNIFNYSAGQLLPLASKESADKQQEKLKMEGCRRLEKRLFRVRLSTGHEVKVESYYARQIPKNWTAPRHSISNYWNVIGNTSPGLYDRISFCSTLAPSYDID
ncbi:MAG: hypothetical protein ACI81W_000808 [Saprospiraceae bacterium]